MAFFVRHVADVDGLGIVALFADDVESAGNGGIKAKADKLRGHKGAGGVLRVLKELIYVLSRLRVGVFKYAFYYVGGHLLDDVNGIVKVEVVKNLFELRVGKAPDEHLLGIAFEFDENVRGGLLRKEPEHHRKVFLGHIVEKKGNIRRV